MKAVPPCIFTLPLKPIPSLALPLKGRELLRPSQSSHDRRTGQTLVSPPVEPGGYLGELGKAQYFWESKCFAARALCRGILRHRSQFHSHRLRVLSWLHRLFYRLQGDHPHFLNSVSIFSVLNG